MRFEASLGGLRLISAFRGREISVHYLKLFGRQTDLKSMSEKS